MRSLARRRFTDGFSDGCAGEDVDVHSYTSSGRIHNDTEVEEVETEMTRSARCAADFEFERSNRARLSICEQPVADLPVTIGGIVPLPPPPPSPERKFAFNAGMIARDDFPIVRENRWTPRAMAALLASTRNRRKESGEKASNLFHAFK